MVKRIVAMLIKAFCEATDLPRDTVRFYVRRGLLKPSIGSRPGNRYQVFDAAQVERAKLIRAAQRLGFTLKQIAELGKRYDAEEVGSEAKMAVLRVQVAQLAAQERELRRVRKYLAAKLNWVEGGEVGAMPSFDERAEVRPASGSERVVSQDRPLEQDVASGCRSTDQARTALLGV